jgi:hypothetical protein
MIIAGFAAHLVLFIVNCSTRRLIAHLRATIWPALVGGVVTEMKARTDRNQQSRSTAT